ncbi:hypothetical protein Pla163_17670 [Planctomycetes bacterium Pla163]|uniref:Uncharacterized protein n=1 Tax=Rohdeia mirabilis TaxID=2528008 RepID=A0A518CZN5_9BACT|nr:hypothetical protein Pla163_17670 [Planctomycetes bacterium Pla163]
MELVGQRYAYSFPSRADDLVLFATVDAQAPHVAGTFEARIQGDADPAHLGPLDEHWTELVPRTAARGDEDEATRRLEHRADQIARLHRAKLRELVRRLVANVAGE